MNRNKSACPGAARLVPAGPSRRGSARQARPGSARPGSARLGPPRPGSTRPGSVRPGPACPTRPGSRLPHPTDVAPRILFIPVLAGQDPPGLALARHERRVRGRAQEHGAPHGLGHGLARENVDL